MIKEELIGGEANPGGEDMDSVLLSFRFGDQEEFPEGIYRVNAGGQEEWFYLRTENDWKTGIGLIDIHHNELVGTDYRFLESDGRFRLLPGNKVDTREYVVRFAPAQYLLKYVCVTDKVLSITDGDGLISFSKTGDHTFVSTLPVRMSEKAIDTLSVQYDGADDITDIKNPGHRRLSLSDDGNRYLVSEAFLNL